MNSSNLKPLNSSKRFQVLPRHTCALSAARTVTDGPGVRAAASRCAPAAPVTPARSAACWRASGTRPPCSTWSCRCGSPCCAPATGRCSSGCCSTWTTTPSGRGTPPWRPPRTEWRGKSNSGTEILWEKNGNRHNGCRIKLRNGWFNYRPLYLLQSNWINCCFET